MDMGNDLVEKELSPEEAVAKLRQMSGAYPQYNMPVVLSPADYYALYPPTLKVKRVRPNAVIPQYMTAGAAGFDLTAAEDVAIAVGDVKLVGTGLAFEIPAGHVMMIAPRSGYSIKFPAYVSNAPGIIDEDYRGEVKIIMTAFTQGIVVRQGDRIAQGLIVPVARVGITETTQLEDTARGSGGFGSTGK